MDLDVDLSIFDEELTKHKNVFKVMSNVSSSGNNSSGISISAILPHQINGYMYYILVELCSETNLMTRRAANELQLPIRKMEKEKMCTLEGIG